MGNAPEQAAAVAELAQRLLEWSAVSTAAWPAAA
jgi:hypothetical protein